MGRVRVRNTVIAATVALALTSASTVGARAQDDGGPAVFEYVTGMVLTDSSPQEDWQRAWWDGGVVHVRDWRAERTIDWSDSRLPPLMVSRTNADTWLSEDDIVQMYAQTVRLDGLEGAWTGTGSTFVIEHGQPAHELITLTGDGAYKGLSAMFVTEVLRGDPNATDTVVLRGYIFEGELPPLPEPPPLPE